MLRPGAGRPLTDRRGQRTAEEERVGRFWFEQQVERIGPVATWCAARAGAVPSPNGAGIYPAARHALPASI